MTLGIWGWGNLLGCVDGSTPFGVQDALKVNALKKKLSCYTFVFDMLAIITLITVASLGLKGRIHLRPALALGLMGAAGGIVLFDASVLLFRCYQRSLSWRRDPDLNHK